MSWASLTRSVSRAVPLALIWFTVFFFVFPLIVVVSCSISGGGFREAFPPAGLTFKWFELLIGREVFIDALRVSIVLGVSAAAISLVTGTLFAFAIVRYRFKGRDLLNSIVLSPLITPEVITGFSLMNFFALTSVTYVFEKMLIGHVIFTLPYVIRAVVACLMGVDVSLEEAAMNLGANRFKTFRYVTIPLIKPGLIAGIIFTFCMSLDNVATTVFITGHGFYTLPVELWVWIRTMFEPTIAAVSVLLIAITVCIVLVAERTLGLDRLVGF